MFFIFSVCCVSIKIDKYVRSTKLNYYLAIDIGASSGRHIVGWCENGEIHTKEVFRFPNGVVREGDRLTWDIDRLYKNVVEGIREAFSLYPGIESLSVDTWGVDYVLMREDEEIYPVYAYRDSRTEAVIPELHGIIPFSELYARTGCQFQPFNTIYQLYDDKISGRLDAATDMLMIPEYLLYKLSGVKAREFPELSRAGRVLGELLPELSSAVGGSCKVVLCATHDTGSAVEGIPMEGNHPYISSGTWSLLGGKTEKPITDKVSEIANYSNEGGVGYNRYQKNIMGMWVINELKRELCPDLSFEEITRMAQESSFSLTVDVNSADFLSPKSMRAVFDQWLGVPLSTGDYFRSAYLSLAESYRVAIDELEANTGKTYSKIYIVGGGAKNEFLNRLTAEATGKEIIALPIEATAIGNLKIQMEVK